MNSYELLNTEQSRRWKTGIEIRKELDKMIYSILGEPLETFGSHINAIHRYRKYSFKININPTQTYIFVGIFRSVASGVENVESKLYFRSDISSLNDIDELDRIFKEINKIRIKDLF